MPTNKKPGPNTMGFMVAGDAYEKLPRAFGRAQAGSKTVAEPQSELSNERISTEQLAALWALAPQSLQQACGGVPAHLSQS